MGINFFVLFIIIVSLIITNLSVEKNKNIIKYINIPIVTFTDSIMYELNINEVKQIVVSSQALNFKNRDELYDATILRKNDYNNTNTISAEYILSKNEMYKLYQNVDIEVKEEKTSILKSDYVEFDEKNNILKTNKDFFLKYDNNQLIGENLYFDINHNIIKAKNTKFKIKYEEK